MFERLFGAPEGVLVPRLSFFQRLLVTGIKNGGVRFDSRHTPYVPGVKSVGAVWLVGVLDGSKMLSDGTLRACRDALRECECVWCP